MCIAMYRNYILFCDCPCLQEVEDIKEGIVVVEEVEEEDTREEEVVVVVVVVEVAGMAIGVVLIQGNPFL